MVDGFYQAEGVQFKFPEYCCNLLCFRNRLGRLVAVFIDKPCSRRVSEVLISMKPYVRISIRTKIETVGWDVGSQLLESLLLNENESLLAPEFVSHNPDSVKELFAVEGLWAEKGSMCVNGSLSDFFCDFAWKRNKNIKCSGYVRHTKRNVRNQIVPGGVHLNSVFSDKVDWYQLLKVWCEIFPPQLGMLHYFTEPELGPHEVNDSFQIGSFNAALRPDVPNAGWAMFYGN